MHFRLIQRSRSTVRMVHYFQLLSQSLSWFDMSANISKVISQVRFCVDIAAAFFILHF
jgi:hypothetical protein